jgi:hypothetical protein
MPFDFVDAINVISVYHACGAESAEELGNGVDRPAALGEFAEDAETERDGGV